jgi:hypothetical protein
MKSNQPKLGRLFGPFVAADFISAEQILSGLHRGEVGMVQAMPGVGKSTLMYNVAICAAIGREFNPILPEASAPRKVMYLDFENREQILQKDLSRMAGTLDDYERDLLNKNLIICCDVRMGDQSLRLSDPNHMKLLADDCSDHSIDLLIIDALASSYDFQSENDNSEIQRVVIGPIQKLLKDCGAAGLLIHHIGKFESRAGSHIYASRGASALPAYSRVVFGLSNDKRTDCVILSCVKIKGVRFEDTILRLDQTNRWFAPVVQPNSNAPQTRRTTYQRVIDLVTCELSRKEINDLAQALGISTASVGRELRNALDRGDLVNTSRGRYSKPSQIAADSAARGQA